MGNDGVGELLKFFTSEDMLANIYELAAPQIGFSSPFSPVYLIAAATICWFWLQRVEKMSWPDARVYLREKFKSRRSIVLSDFLWTVGHLVLLRAPLAWVHAGIFQWSYKGSLLLRGSWEKSWTLEAPRWVEGLLATLITMLAIDAAAFLVHRLLHSHPWLWRAHRLHHASTFLTPFTTFRQHPLEALLLASGRGLAAGLGLGLLHLLLPQCTPVWTYGGMGLGFFLYMFTINLHHAPIPVRYPQVLSKWLVSPHMHHIHHSCAEEHYDVNFGVVFSIWDRMGSTLLDLKVGLDELKFGLSEDELESLEKEEQGPKLSGPLTFS